jgi:cytochrome o ubiquinol oxidase subunit 2
LPKSRRRGTFACTEFVSKMDAASIEKPEEAIVNSLDRANRAWTRVRRRASCCGDSIRSSARLATSTCLRPGALRTAGFSALLAPIALTACGPAVLDPQGPVGEAEKTILIDSLAIMLAIVVPTIATIGAFAWWFRASNEKATYLPDWDFSGRLELVVWSIPTLVVMLLGGVAWIGSHDLDPARPLAAADSTLEVQVVSTDWKWLFIYPGRGVASVNQLAIPVGMPIRFTLTSASVMNAFFIPQLGSMIYTMNGMTTQLHLQADTQGTFLGLSSHYSGDGFADMHFDVLALPAERFEAWVGAARREGPTLDSAAYTALIRQSTNPVPFTFRETEPGLFEQIVTQKLPPGPGPEAGRPGSSVSPRRGM